MSSIVTGFLPVRSCGASSASHSGKTNTKVSPLVPTRAFVASQFPRRNALRICTSQTAVRSFSQRAPVKVMAVVAAPPAAAPPPTLPPPKVLETAINLAASKAAYSWQKCLCLSVLAGMQIGVGALLMTVVGGGSPGIAAANPGLHKFLLGSIGLPVGLVLVTLTGGELFTGNTFVMTAGLLAKRVTAQQLARNWLISFWGNFAGCLLVCSLAFVAGTTAAAPWSQASLNIAAAKVAAPFATAFVKGVLCNWLVCSAVWLAMASNSLFGKVLGIWLSVSTFVSLGFEHSIANMFLIPQGILNGSAVTVSDMITKNIVPVTLGNIVGGAVLIAAAYWYSHGDHDLF